MLYIILFHRISVCDLTLVYLPDHALTRVLPGHPDEVHLRGPVHVVDGGHHQDVHDVVRVPQRVALAGKPVNQSEVSIVSIDLSELCIYHFSGMLTAPM